MRRTGKVILVGAGVAAGAAAAGLARGRKSFEPSGNRHSLTVHRPLTEVEAAPLPGPLGEIASDVEVRLRAAPGDRGTEISVRIPESSSVDSGTVRRALRETRSLLEVGDVLRPDAPSTTVPTLLNRPLRAVTRRGREGGLL